MATTCNCAIPEGPGILYSTTSTAKKLEEVAKVLDMGGSLKVGRRSGALREK